MREIVLRWKEITLWFIIGFVYTLCCSPDLSWAGFDCDLADFMNSAKHAEILHFPGFPIYSMFGFVLVRVPIYTEAWRLAFFLSTVPAILSCIFVFFAVQKQTLNKWAPYVSCVALAGANIFIMQSIIVEIYSLTAFFLIVTYAFIVYEKNKLAAVFAGLSCSMHILILPSIFAMLLWHKSFRMKWKIMLLAWMIPYVYVMIIGVVHESPSTAESSPLGLIQYSFSTLSDNTTWWLSLPVTQFPQRVFETAAIFCSAFGLSLLPMYFGLSSNKYFLLAVVAVPLIYFVGCVSGVAVAHLALVAPFLAVSVGLGLSQIKFVKHSDIFIVSLLLLIILPFSYDIGETLDENLTAKESYEAFAMIREESIVTDLAFFAGGTKSYTSGRNLVLMEIYEKDRDIDFIDIRQSLYLGKNVFWSGKTGLDYRQDLKYRYNINTPFDDEWNDLQFIDILSKSNPSKDVYFTELDVNNSFARRLVKYDPQNY